MKSNIDQRRALEALRNGVPNREAVRILGCSQPKAENAFLERLDTVQSAAHSGKQAKGLLVSGGFGSGKSHLLDHFEHLALEQNFVASRVVISKETPLFDPTKMFLAAIDGATVPSVKGEVIREIAQLLDPRSDAYLEFSEWAKQPSSGLSPLFAATLLLHERLHNDPELVDQITNFWSGERLAISRIRQGLKQIGYGGLFALKPVKVTDLALQRFRFASRLMMAAGFSGWVLLIDELELVGRYSQLQRGRSYAELARWTGRASGDAYPGLFTVAAITDDFGLAVLQEKSDRDLIGTKLRAKETDEFVTIAARAEVGMRFIEREALPLRPPDESMLAESYQRLKALHGTAYNWEPPEIPAADAAMSKLMRSYVRLWVNEWDLRRLYPNADICTEEEPALRPSYVQDELLEVSQAAGESDE